MKCTARQQRRSASKPGTPSTASEAKDCTQHSRSSDSKSSSAFVSTIAQDMAALQTTLAVTQGKLGVASSQLEARERELLRVQGELRALENSTLNSSYVPAPTYEAPNVREALVEGVNSICSALSVKSLSDLCEESRLSSVGPSCDSTESLREPLISSNICKGDMPVSCIDSTIAMILKVIEDKSLQINFLTNSLDLLNLQLDEERGISQGLTETVKRLQKSNSALSEELIELRLAGVMHSLPQIKEPNSYSMMTREDLLKELRSRDLQLANLTETLRSSTHLTDSEAREYSEAVDDAVAAFPDAMGEDDIVDTVKRFIKDYREISSSTSASAPPPSAILDLLMDAVKLRMISKHKLGPGELEKDMAVIESSFILKQIQMRDKEIVRLKELLHERDLQMSQLQTQSPLGATKGLSSTVFGGLSGGPRHAGLTPDVTRVPVQAPFNEDQDLKLTLADSPLEHRDSGLHDVLLSDPSLLKEAVVISFSAKLKKVPVSSVRNYGPPTYFSNGLTVASRVNLNSSLKVTSAGSDILSSADDLMTRDLAL